MGDMDITKAGIKRGFEGLSSAKPSKQAKKVGGPSSAGMEGSGMDQGEPVTPPNVKLYPDGYIKHTLKDTFTKIIKTNEVLSDNSFFGTCITPFRQKIKDAITPYLNNISTLNVGPLKAKIHNFRPIVNNVTSDGTVVHSGPINDVIMQIADLTKVKDLSQGIDIVEFFGRNSDDTASMNSVDNLILIPFLFTELKMRTNKRYVTGIEVKPPESGGGLTHPDERFLPLEQVYVSKKSWQTVETETGKIFAEFTYLPTLEEVQILRSANAAETLINKKYLHQIKSGVTRNNWLDLTEIQGKYFRDNNFKPIQNKIRNSKAMTYHAMNEPFEYISHPGYTVKMMVDQISKTYKKITNMTNEKEENVARVDTVDRVLYPYINPPVSTPYTKAVEISMYDAKVPRMKLDDRHGEILDKKNDASLILMSIKAPRNGLDEKPLPVSVQFDITYEQEIGFQVCSEPGLGGVNLNRTDIDELDLGVLKFKTRSDVVDATATIQMMSNPVWIGS